jgi:hypothetical protein
VNPLIVQAAPARGSVRPRPRRSLALGLVGVAALGLVACAPDNTPTSYDAVAESSFLQSCTGDAPEYQGTTTTLAGSAYCGCAYQVFVENVPFNTEDKENRRNESGDLVFASYSGKTYLEYNTEMRSDPNILAQDIVDKLDDCKENPEVVQTPSGTTPATSASGTTTPAEPS